MTLPLDNDSYFSLFPKCMRILFFLFICIGYNENSPIFPSKMFAADF